MSRICVLVAWGLFSILLPRAILAQQEVQEATQAESQLTQEQQPDNPVNPPEDKAHQPDAAHDVAPPPPPVQEKSIPTSQQEQSMTRTVTGRVTASGRPLVGASVALPDANLSTNTNEAGEFTLEGVPQVSFRLLVKADSYLDEQLTVAAFQDRVEVELTLSQLEEIVVTGRATRVARKNLAHSVTKVRGSDITQVSSQTFSEALQGRIAGANIQANSGAPGGGIQLRLRGISTINGRAEPLYVIDGVIISDVAIPSGLSAVTASSRGSNSSSTQDNQVNRIADLNINDIRSIEILKGASAAAIYGAKASNGVVVITTKRGRYGKSEQPSHTEVSFSQRLGFYDLSNKLGLRSFRTVEDAVAVFGEKARQHYQPGRVYDHEQALAGNNDLSNETSLSVGGWSGNTDYYFSFLARKDAGIIDNTGHEKQSLRLNLGHVFSDKFQITAFTNVIHSLTRRGVTNNDNSGISHYMVLAFTPSFFDLGQGSAGYRPNPYIGSTANPLQTAMLASDKEDLWRIMGSVTAALELYNDFEHDVEINAVAGIDRFQQKNQLYFPPELFFEPVDDGLPGSALLSSAENLNFNLGFNLVYAYTPMSGLFESTTSTGFQHEERALDRIYIVSRNLIGGKSVVDAGTQIEVNEERELVRDQGFYFQEEVLLLEETLTLTGAIRGERSSVNGDPDEFHFYPKASASYAIPTFDDTIVDQFKVRFAYGETGNQPLYGQRFTPMIISNNIEGTAGIVSGTNAGDPSIKPERQREFEGGIDLVAFSERVLFEITLYQRNITELLLQRALAPSSGFENQFFNGGELRNRGIEIMLTANPIKNLYGFDWLSVTTFALNRSTIVDLPIPSFVTGGFGVSLGAFRIEQGASATQIVGNKGLKEDGTCCNVEAVGDTEPTFRMSFFNKVSWGPLSLSFLLDWQQGTSIINLTRFLFDLGQNTADFEKNGQQRLDNFGTQTSVYVEDGSFLKLRELTLSYQLPDSWAKTVLATSAALSLSARNLFVITGYSGLDPEVSNFGNRAIARNIDVAPYPPSRSFWLTVNARF